MGRRFFENPFSDSHGNVQIDNILWKRRIKELVDMIKKNQKTGKQECDGGLYVGAIGVAYMLWYASSRIPDVVRGMEAAGKLATAHYRFCQTNPPRDAGEKLGFLLGNTGVYAMNAVIAKQIGDSKLETFLNEFRHATKNYFSPDPLGVGSDEMLVGRAGYLAGTIWLQKQMTGLIVLEEKDIYKLCDVMVLCGKKYAKKVKSPCPLMYQYHGTEYLGAAHGLTGILQMLLSIPGYFGHNPSAGKDVKDSVDFLLSLQTDDGIFPCAMDEIGTNSRRRGDQLVHWCHGAPGTVYLLARAHFTWPEEEKYQESMVRAADLVWQGGLLKKGPGICHGLAGSGYVFLLMHRLTGNSMYLHRALKFAEFLYERQFKTAHTPDSPLSLYEGWSGTVCFLIDLLEPDKAAFPFSDVFV